MTRIILLFFLLSFKIFAEKNEFVIARPDWVVIDFENKAYTLICGLVQKNISDFENFKNITRSKESTYLITFREFQSNLNNYLKNKVIKNEYSAIKTQKGLVELLKMYPGTPFGLTWNGGIAFTQNDFRYAVKTYDQYKSNLKEYEKERQKTLSDIRFDRINQLNHILPLLIHYKCVLEHVKVRDENHFYELLDRFAKESIKKDNKNDSASFINFVLATLDQNERKEIS